MSEENLEGIMSSLCRTHFGVLDRGFLCQSVSQLKLSEPLTISVGTALEDVLVLLQSKKSGCVMIVDGNEALAGIFSERDFILKVASGYEHLKRQPISDFMTGNPETVLPDATVAYALTLMSHGGFRHLPVVSTDGTILGMLSVKNIVDTIVSRVSEDLDHLDLELT